jgi:hypothetical protein
MQLRQDDPAADWTVPDVYEVDPGLYRTPLPLPHDSLRAVNVYAVRDGDRLVLVDSGWALTEARDLLEQAVKMLGAVDPPGAAVRRAGRLQPGPGRQRGPGSSRRTGRRRPAESVRRRRDLLLCEGLT